MIQTGISLSPPYLAGVAGTDDAFNRALGPVTEALPKLRQAGISSIEIRMVRPGMDVDLIRRCVSVVKDAGLNCTLHGLLHPVGEDPRSISAFPLWGLSDWLADQQAEWIVTVHARFGVEGDVEELAGETSEALRQLLEERDRRSAPFTFALEISRLKQKVDPSFTWNGVVGMVNAVDHPALGICWDFGHAYFNSLRGLISRNPPESFLQRVVHTHIHDLSPNDQTHWPLRLNKVPVDDYCGLLAAQGYRGVYNLELGPDRFVSDPELDSLLYSSVDRLRKSPALSGILPSP